MEQLAEPVVIEEKKMDWPELFKIVKEDNEIESPWRIANAEEVKENELALKTHLLEDQRFDFAGGRMQGKKLNDGETIFINEAGEVPDYDRDDPVDDILIVKDDV